MQRLLADRRRARPEGVRLCAVGPSTAERLARYGIRVDLMPAEYRAEAVVEALRAAGDAQGRARPAAARRHRPRGARRRAARARAPRSPRSSPTGRSPAAAERDGDPDIYRMLLDGRSTPSRSPARRRSQLRRRCSARSRPPTCCARRWSRRSGRSPPRRRSSSASRRRSCRSATRFRDLVDALVEHFSGSTSAA